MTKGYVCIPKGYVCISKGYVSYRAQELNGWWAAPARKLWSFITGNRAILVSGISVIVAPGPPGVQEFRSGYTVSINYMNHLTNLYYCASASSHLAVTEILHQSLLICIIYLQVSKLVPKSLAEPVPTNNYTYICTDSVTHFSPDIAYLLSVRGNMNYMMLHQNANVSALNQKKIKCYRFHRWRHPCVSQQAKEQETKVSWKRVFTRMPWTHRHSSIANDSNCVLTCCIHSIDRLRFHSQILSRSLRGKREVFG